MKQKKIEAKFYATIDSEEIYLNQMCQKGWKPVEIFLGIFFCFERCQPGEYIARVTTTLDADGGKGKREQLVEYLTDSGAQIVHETNLDAKTRIYAIRPASLGEFEINTDTDSLMADYRARRKFHVIWSVITAAMFVMLTLFGFDFLREAQSAADPTSALHGALTEFIGAGFLLLCLIAIVIPIGKYSRKIRELREKREIEE